MSDEPKWRDLGNGYESRTWTNKAGNTGFITRPIGQGGDYPHDTTFFNRDGSIDEHRSYGRHDHDYNIIHNKSFWWQNDPDFGR